MAPICVSVINMKGGVGKTTIAALLGRHAAAPDLKVLAVDLDPQANLSQALMGERSYRQFLSNKSPSIVEVFDAYQPPTPEVASTSTLDIDNVLHRTSVPNLYIIPSRFDFSDNLVRVTRTDERVLARLIASNLQDVDIIIIDCAPTESILTRAAYHASRYILVPVRPEYFATIGFPLLNESLDDFRSRNRGHQIDVMGVVINNAFYDGGNDGGPEKERALTDIYSDSEQNGWYIFRNQLPHSRGYPKLMRGDYSWPGKAISGFRPIAEEFFENL